MAQLHAGTDDTFPKSVLRQIHTDHLSHLCAHLSRKPHKTKHSNRRLHSTTRIPLQQNPHNPIHLHYTLHLNKILQNELHHSLLYLPPHAPHRDAATTADPRQGKDPRRRSSAQTTTTTRRSQRYYGSYSARFSWSVRPILRSKGGR